ncbi:F-box protein At5g07610-like [Bidens hawaiensis]|uniref:F-box protein At5g07610-like n=1 Tax=Bidens hawaiensis TaxID=980011 RepID=UPI00404AF072
MVLVNVMFTIPPPSNWHSSHQSPNASILWLWRFIKPIVCTTKLFVLQPNGNLIQVQVYSSDTGKWKICVESFSVQNLLFRQPVYWNGAVYWAPCYRNFCYFKIDVERLQTSSMQEGLMSNEISTMYFGESSGHLHLISKTKREETSLIVYEMLMDHSGWFVKYRIQLDELLSAFPEMVNQFGYSFEVVDVVRGKEEDTFLVLVTTEKMIRYNVHDKSFKELVSNNNVSLFIGVHRYIETLSSI